ncbi:hypothetical protein [Pseudomonas sp. KCJK9000]|uniref:hypothetical protein n=1 Tax=Pseudomonas sp. KCJK9000 TaxID=3344566 RepID=UPI00390656E2
MKLSRTTTHTQTTTASLAGDDLKRVIAQAVAQAAGIDLDAAGVEQKVWLTTRPVTGTAGSEHVAEVTITQLAQPKGHIDFSGSVRAPIKRGDTIRWHENGVEHSGPVAHHTENPGERGELRCKGLTLAQIHDRADRDSVTIVG